MLTGTNLYLTLAAVALLALLLVNRRRARGGPTGAPRTGGGHVARERTAGRWRGRRRGRGAAPAPPEPRPLAAPPAADAFTHAGPGPVHGQGDDDRAGWDDLGDAPGLAEALRGEGADEPDWDAMRAELTGAAPVPEPVLAAHEETAAAAAPAAPGAGEWTADDIITEPGWPLPGDIEGDWGAAAGDGPAPAAAPEAPAAAEGWLGTGGGADTEWAAAVDQAPAEPATDDWLGTAADGDWTAPAEATAGTVQGDPDWPVADDAWVTAEIPVAGAPDTDGTADPDAPPIADGGYAQPGESAGGATAEPAIWDAAPAPEADAAGSDWAVDGWETPEAGPAAPAAGAAGDWTWEPAVEAAPVDAPEVAVEPEGWTWAAPAEAVAPAAAVEAPATAPAADAPVIPGVEDWDADTPAAVPAAPAAPEAPAAPAEGSEMPGALDDLWGTPVAHAAATAPASVPAAAPAPAGAGPEDTARTGRFSIGGMALGEGHEAIAAVTFRRPLPAAPAGWAVEDGADHAPGTLVLDVQGTMNCRAEDVAVMFDPGFAPGTEAFTLRLSALAAGPFAASGTFRVVGG